MATWQLLTNEVARKTWDEALLQLDDYTPFQSYAWGEYQRALGWEPCRWAAFDEHGEIVAMLQGLVRRYPLKFGIIWSEGGPVGDLTVCDESLQRAIEQTTGLKRVYCRFRCDRQRQVEDALRLSAQGWHRSWFSLTTSYSMSLDLAHEESQLLAACERNWRRNLRRAAEGNITVRQWHDPTVDEIVTAYTSMQCLKGLEEQHSREEFEYLLKHLKKQIVIYRCDDEHGELISLHGWLIFGNRATAVLSATTERGRELHASYAVVWALVQHCLLLNVQSCDLAGIDPVMNPGGYRFKKSTGAVTIEYLGEWDRASRPWLQWFGNWAISRRQQIRKAESALKSSPRAAPSKPLLEDARSRAKLTQPTMT
jgi:lipid II:glycine glycyltransferase (peptidoglycan interpeptide bridge formation enzyme)